MKLGTILKAKKKYNEKHNDFFISKNDLLTVVKIEDNKIHVDYVKDEWKLKHLLKPEIHVLYIDKSHLDKFFTIEET